MLGDYGCMVLVVVDNSENSVMSRFPVSGLIPTRTLRPLERMNSMEAPLSMRSLCPLGDTSYLLERK